MAKIEVEESEWQRAQNVVRTVTDIMKDPKRRQKQLELQKEAQPETPIPEVDAANTFNEALTSINKKFDEFKTELQADREKRAGDQAVAEFEAKQKSGRVMLQTRGFSSEGIEKIEKMMGDEGIADYDNAVVIWNHRYPPQEPIRSSPSNFLREARSPDADELTKQLIASQGNDDFVLDQMIDAIRRESRGQ